MKEVRVIRNWRLDIQWIVVFVGVWVILFGDFSTFTLITGALMGAVSLWITEKMLIGEMYYKHYPLDLLKLSYYGILLVYEIYKAGILVIPLVFSAKVNIRAVDISTELEDDYSISILANSITLTPGTITLDKNGQHLKILWLNAVTKDSIEAGRLIKGSLEKRLLPKKRGSK
jgi:multicomponent Na+:H+ antiporter subunit E